MTRRARYILKWNGPHCAADIKRNYRHAKATCGKGDVGTREAATAYRCRFQGWFPATVEEFGRLSGVGKARGF